ncbi:MAG: hypothetical protein KDK59_02145 [Simkania sp.]|nr:hypothetical protein [Simkania sp.]
MSTDITHSKQFIQFIKYNTDENNIAEFENADKIRANISKMAQSVISYLGDKSNPSLENIPEFAEKLSIVNEQFKAHGDGTPFATSLTAINILLGLRQNLSEGNQEIINRPFFKQLDKLLAQEPIENEITVVTNLHLFLENCLIPSVMRAQSKAELNALEPVMKKCFVLGKRLAGVDPEGKLLKLKEESIQKYNSKAIIFDPRYQILIGYDKGTIGSLESEESRIELVKNLTGFFANFPRSNITEVVPKSEQAALYDAILMIQDELEEYGDGARLEPVRNQLGLTVGSFDGIRSGFPVELRQLAEGEIEGSYKPILKKLVAFEKKVLIPALAQVSTSEELFRLEPLVDQCIALKSKIEGIDAKGKLQASHQDLINQWNAKNYQTSRIHRFLVSYKSGDLPGIDKEERRENITSSIQSHIDRICPELNHETFTTVEKRDLYQALLDIQGEFEKYGDGQRLEPVIEKLGKALGIPDGIRDAFPIELAQSYQTPLELSQKQRFLKKLVAFEHRILMPAIVQASTETLEIYKPLLIQCAKLREQLIDVDVEGLSAAPHQEAIALYRAKEQQVKNEYDLLRTYTSGKISDLDKPSGRKAIEGQLSSYLNDLIPHLDHSIFSEEDKRTILKGLLTLQQDFKTDGRHLDPVIQKYRKAIGMHAQAPKESMPHSRSKEKSQEIDTEKVRSTRSMWEKKSSSESTTGPAAHKTKERSEETPEAKLIRYTANIKKSIASLDLDSPMLKENIDEIRRQITFIRKLPGSSPSKLEHLEQALNLLINPDEISISKEEYRLITLLGAQHGCPDVKEYQGLERASVRDAQSSILGQLKGDFDSLNRLELKAERSFRGVKERTVQYRFERFRDAHTFTPPLNQNFATHFPAILNAFTIYTQRIATEGLMIKWDQIKSVRDKETGGRFSKLIEKFYSHIDPSKQIPTYTTELQQSFVTDLNLSQIDRMNERELTPYLVEKMESFIEVPGKWLGGFYTSTYGGQHDWLVRNIDRIIRPYNQGDEPNTNLGGGVCYNNSLQVQRSFLDGPVSSKTLLLGSNETTRYHQSRIQSEYEELSKIRENYSTAYKKYEKGDLSEAEITELHKKLVQAEDQYKKVEAALPSAYRLKLHGKYPLSNPPSGTSVQDHLSNTIEEWSAIGHKQIVLVLRKPSGEGHAVNVQFDAEKGSYRLRDDNKGIIEFEDMPTMKRELSAYFRVFYPEFDKFTFESYTRA